MAEQGLAFYLGNHTEESSDSSPVAEALVIDAVEKPREWTAESWEEALRRAFASARKAHNLPDDAVFRPDRAIPFGYDGPVIG